MLGVKPRKYIKEYSHPSYCYIAYEPKKNNITKHARVEIICYIAYEPKKKQHNQTRESRDYVRYENKEILRVYTEKD